MSCQLGGVLAITFWLWTNLTIWDVDERNTNHIHGRHQKRLENAAPRTQCAFQHRIDLEEFDGLDEMTRNPTWSKTTDLDPGSIIEEADEKWYIKASRAARWMDLLGDYAGGEPFIVDGTSHHLYSLPPLSYASFR